MTAAEQAAIVCTLGMIRGEAVRAVSGRFVSNLLHELMTGDDLEGVSARAATLDWALNREIVVVAARPEDGRHVAGRPTEQSQVLEQLTSERWPRPAAGSIRTQQLDQPVPQGVVVVVHLASPRQKVPDELAA